MNFTTHIKYRDYQINCLESMNKHYLKNDKGIICIPTGGGKTIVFSKFSEGKRSLIVSHTEELVFQAKAKYEFVTEKSCGIVNANNWDSKYDVVSGSIQTLHARVDTKEFKSLVKNLEYLIVDEAHHFPADTYMTVYFKILEYNPSIKLLGVTATPFRSDNLELKEYFNDMIFNVNIKTLIQDKHLVPTRAKIIRIPENLAIFNKINIRKNSNGITDFSLKSLSNVLGEEKVLDYVIANFIKEYNGRKTLFFTTSIEVSKNLVLKLKEEGINAVHIDGTVPKKERNIIIKNYQSGKIDVLSNVNILTEGFDDPSTECIALLRPTKSLNLYAQIIGRGLRPSPETNKEDCLVLDFTPATSKFSKGLANLFELFDLEADSKSKDHLEQFTINSSNGGLVVNFGTGTDELELFNNQVHLKDEIININDKEILSCGHSHHILLSHSKDNYGLNKIEIINTLNNEVEHINGIPENIVMSKMYELWEEIKTNVRFQKKENREPRDIIAENLEYINLINRNIFSMSNCDHNDMIVEDQESMEDMNLTQVSTLNKYIKYLNEFTYSKEEERKSVICEDLSVNYSGVKFDNFKQVLDYYTKNKRNVEFENELIGDFVKYLSPVEDDLWIPEAAFIEHRKKDSFEFRIMVDGKFKNYKVVHKENKDKEIYKHILYYIAERICHIRKNKSNNSKYYRVPTVKYLKRIMYVSKKLDYYKEMKHLFTAAT